jgi:hypothetical protein
MWKEKLHDNISLHRTHLDNFLMRNHRTRSTRHPAVCEDTKLLAKCAAVSLTQALASAAPN